ncbi:hypothetical protein D3C73_1081210 [compost metagenome]
MAAAVFSTLASGRKDRATVQVAMKKASTRVNRPTPTTTRTACSITLSTGVSGSPMITTPFWPLAVTPMATTRQLLPAVPLTWKGELPRSLASAAVMFAIAGRSLWLPPKG